MHAMFSLPQRQIYPVDASSPAVLSPTSTTPALGPRTTVVFRNLAGEGKAYTLQGCSVAKVVIDGCSNFTLRINTPLLTGTLEVFNSRDLTIHLGSAGAPQPVAATVLLDPPLPNVQLVVPLAQPSPSFVLSTAIPPSAKLTSPESAWEGTTLRAAAVADGEDDLVLLVAPPPKGGPEQNTIRLELDESGGWHWAISGLEREEAGGEGDGYPILR